MSAAGIAPPSEPEVRRFLEREAAAHPDWADVRNQIGLLRAAEGNFEEAKEHFHEALYRNPRYAWASLNLAVAQFASGRWEHAREQMRCNADPCAPAAALTRGWMALLDGRPESAHEALQDLSPEHRERTDVRWLLAAVAETLDTPGRERAWQAVESDPVVAESPAEIDFLRTATGPRALAGLFPGWHQLWLAVSRAETHAGRFDAARRAARLAYLHFSRRETYLNQLGFIAEMEGNVDEAVRRHVEAMEAAPRDPVAPAALARLCSVRDDLDGAVGYLERALEAAPRYADLLRFMGQLEFARHRFDAALDFTRRALAINPRYQVARVDEANALFRLGRWGEASTAYRRLLDGGIVSADILVHLGRCLEDRNAQEACGLYGEALRLNPRELLAHVRLVPLLRRLGDNHAADRHQREAMELAADASVLEPVEDLLVEGLFADPDVPVRRAG